ncbi:MAG: haloacid dehalogenase-like hydrolase [archaeon]|jgi:phosphoserine phosphatase
MVKAVFTDIDGTLLQGFITIDFVEYLHKKDLFSEASYLQQNKLMQMYKLGQIEFVPWLKEWANIWANGISGLKQETLEAEAKLFFPSFKHKIYSTSKELVKSFQNEGYLVIGISVGVFETAVLIKNFLGMDYVFASQVEVKNGRYVPRVVTDLQSEAGKKKAIESFCKLKKISLKDSIGIGDTIHDKQIFDLTGKKIALNPTPSLIELAKKEGYLLANHENILGKISSFF